ncbi:MAG: DUF669 domain-containing protein [Bacteroidota bacterium]|jgi:hypothetical protein
MADLGFEFDPSSEYAKSGSLVPAGEYAAVCVGSEVAQSTTGTQSLQLKWQICEGPMLNRVVYDRHWIFSKEEDKKRKAYGKLGGLCAAAGVSEKLSKSDVLHGKKVRIKVRIDEGDDRYQASNSVASYKKYAPGLPSAGNASVPSTPAHQHAEDGVKPW